MSVYDNTYSRFVSWAKILLPLAALTLLSTMFLLARKVDTTDSIPFADVDVDGIAREQRISAPNYSGVTVDGAAISIAATTARPDPENRDKVTAEKLHARIDTKGGGQYELLSNTGEIDTAAGVARLGGGVIVTTPSGFRVESEQIDTALERTEVISPGPVTAEGPTGKLTAGEMQLKADEAGNYLLVFKDRVKLVYTPPSE
ncbi:LPS export ABC transporter periplasmic protein LptC [Vannielia sp.]|uniref:LPS export ABC transporter periplasmic protein LptC n=1 Tax=Vannielia sp. TaxID=2813045 RepID=UPI00260AFF1D|nr:LPS export ABC transporter periplasmic protein LptC [Vannielia sp.]MDF1873476.1 hypothetical protein [Vannielia sp.]